MPPFRDWPVCWLFLLATAAADVAMLQRSAEVPWPLGLAVGQMMLLGVWVVHGRAHRLSRGALFVVGLGSLSWLAVSVVEPFSWDWWFVLLTATLAVQGTVAAAAAATAWAGRMAPGQLSVQTMDNRWQYPLIEIFGWTIVVAAASVLLRDADMKPLLGKTEVVVFWLTGCSITGACGSLLYDYRRWPRRVAIPAALLLPGIFWIVWRDKLGGDATVMLAAQFYLATYLFCRWLDADPTEADSRGAS